MCLCQKESFPDSVFSKFGLCIWVTGVITPVLGETLQNSHCSEWPVPLFCIYSFISTPFQVSYDAMYTFSIPVLSWMAFKYFPYALLFPFTLLHLFHFGPFLKLFQKAHIIIYQESSFSFRNQHSYIIYKNLDTTLPVSVHFILGWIFIAFPLTNN